MSRAVVVARYPQARAEQTVERLGGNFWSVWSGPRVPTNSPHPALVRGLLGLGRTEAEAWANAAQTVVLQ